MAVRELGNRTELIDALGRRRECAFDALGREILERKPLGEIASKAYDAAGNLTSFPSAFRKSDRELFDQHRAGARK